MTNRGLNISGRGLHILGRGVDLSATPDSGLEHEYQYESGSGSTLVDDAGAANGSITNAIWESSVVFNGGYALRYGGSTGVNLGDFDIISPGTTGEFSIIITTRHDDPGNNGEEWLIGDEESGNNGFHLQVDDGTNTTAGELTTYFGGTYVGLGYQVPADNYVQYGIRQAGGSVDLFINGQFDSSPISSEPYVDTTASWSLGRWDEDNSTGAGKIRATVGYGDVTLLYTRGLNDQEFADIYNATQ